MGMFDRRRHERSGTQPAIEIKGMPAFIDAPAIIFTAPDEMGGFPEILSVVAGPDAPGFFIEAQAPGIAQAVGPDFRSRIGFSHKWVVPRDRIRPCAVRMIGIDAQHS